MPKNKLKHPLCSPLRSCIAIAAGKFVTSLSFFFSAYLLEYLIFNNCIIDASNFILVSRWEPLETSAIQLISHFPEGTKVMNLRVMKVLPLWRKGEPAVSIHRTMDRKGTSCPLSNRITMLERHSKGHPTHFCTSRQHQLRVHHSKQIFLKMSQYIETLISQAKVILHSFSILTFRKLFIIFLCSSCMYLTLSVPINFFFSRLNKQ